MSKLLGIYLSSWSKWSRQSINRRILFAAVVVGVFTFLVKMVNVIKELFVANRFGTGDDLDAFLIAFLLPSLAINVISGSLNAALIPTYIEVEQNKGRDAAQRLFSNVMVWTVGILLITCILLAVSSSFVISVIGPGFSKEKLVLSRYLFFVLLPVLLFSGISTVWGAVLNAGERFVTTAVTPILTPMASIVALIVGVKLWGIYALAFGTVVGFALEAVVLAYNIKRRGFTLIPVWYGMNPETKQVIKQYTPMVAGAFLMSGNGFIDQSMASLLGSGSVSALNYGNKLVAFMMGVGSLALSTAVLPHFSLMVANRNWKGIRHTLKKFSHLILITTVTITVVLIYFSNPLVGMFFERGAFTASDTRLVGKIQAFYLIQIPFQLLGIIFVRLISSLKANYLLMWGAFINLISNVSLNLIFMRWWGVSGIALSTSVVYLVSCCYLAFSLFYILNKVQKQNPVFDINPED